MASAAHRWLEARQADLLPVEYFHVVFTLPAPISAIAWYNKRIIYGLLLDIAADTLRTIAADPRHLGARIGATLVLHTWGSALTHHPHAHGIVPGGGLSPDGERWIACRPGFFLPVRVLSRLFRRRFLEALADAHRRGQLQFFGEYTGLTDPATFARWLAPLRTCEWVVYAKRPFAGPKAVLEYLSRYTHRVAISNQRLVAFDERGVTFRWKDYRAKGRTRYRTMTLETGEFMRRFLLHVLPAGFHRIRHYGLLANPVRRASLAKVRDLLHVPPEASPPPDDTVLQTRPVFICRHCGAPMIVIDILARSARSAHPRSAGVRHERNTCSIRLSNVGFAATRPTSGRLRVSLRAVPHTSASPPQLHHCTPSSLPQRASSIPPCPAASGTAEHPHRSIAIAAKLQPHRGTPRFPPSRLIRRLPTRAETPAHSCGQWQASNNP